MFRLHVAEVAFPSSGSGLAGLDEAYRTQLKPLYSLNCSKWNLSVVWQNRFCRLAMDWIRRPGGLADGGHLFHGTSDGNCVFPRLGVDFPA
jgi:hypothetical protein